VCSEWGSAMASTWRFVHIFQKGSFWPFTKSGNKLLDPFLLRFKNMQVLQSSMHTCILFAKLQGNYCCKVQDHLENKNPWLSHLVCCYLYKVIESQRARLKGGIQWAKVQWTCSSLTKYEHCSFSDWLHRHI
jgi:hypothetical protein